MSIESTNGQVIGSQCVDSCINKQVGLTPASPYQVLTLNGESSQVNFSVQFATYDASAPGVQPLRN